MKIEIDIKNISEKGFDQYLNNQEYLSDVVPMVERGIRAYDFLGGQLAKNSKLEYGSPLFYTDSGDARTVVNDGATNRIIFGKRPDGTYGIDVSDVGYDVFTSYEGENLLSTKNRDDWTEWNPANFAYSDANTVTVSGYTATDLFQIGDKVKLVQSGTTKYFYITRVQTSSINLRAGTDYTVANAAFTSFSTSKLTSPNGHPIWFNQTSGFTAKDDDGDTVTNGSMTAQYKIDGNVMTIRPNMSFDTNADATNFVQIPFPFSEGTNTTVSLGEQLVNPGIASNTLPYVLTDASGLSGGIDNHFALDPMNTAATIAGLTAFGFRNVFYATFEY